MAVETLGKNLTMFLPMIEVLTGKDRISFWFKDPFDLSNPLKGPANGKSKSGTNKRIRKDRDNTKDLSSEEDKEEIIMRRKPSDFRALSLKSKPKLKQFMDRLVD